MDSKWDIRFLQMASFVASWSKDPSTRVGAVIVDEEKRIVSHGYNGLPRGAADDHRLNIREIKYRLIIHAEENAILNATGSVKGCTIYVSHPPCAHCSGILKQAGIVRVVFEEPSQEFKRRWNLEETLQYLKELKIKTSGYKRVAEG